MGQGLDCHGNMAWIVMGDRVWIVMGTGSGLSWAQGLDCHGDRGWMVMGAGYGLSWAKGLDCHEHMVWIDTGTAGQQCHQFICCASGGYEAVFTWSTNMAPSSVWRKEQAIISTIMPKIIMVVW